MIVQLKLLEKLVLSLKDPNTSEVVTSDLYRVRDTLTLPSNLRVFMATDIDNLTDPLQPWTSFIQRSDKERYKYT